MAERSSAFRRSGSEAPSGAVPEISARGEALVELGGRPVRVSWQFLDDLGQQDAAQSG